MYAICNWADLVNAGFARSRQLNYKH